MRSTLSQYLSELLYWRSMDAPITKFLTCDANHMRSIRKLSKCYSEIESTRENNRWSFWFIKNINKWENCNNVWANFYLCQLLTGHESFRTYLLRLEHGSFSNCPAFVNSVEDVKHDLNWDVSNIKHSKRRVNVLELYLKCTWNIQICYSHWKIHFISQLSSIIKFTRTSYQLTFDTKFSKFFLVLIMNILSSNNFLIAIRFLIR